jgi:hypothetical protein
LVQQLLTAVDSRNGKSPLRQGQRVQADACSQIKRCARSSGRQTNGVQLGGAARQACLDVADHPRIDAAKVVIVVIRSRRHLWKGMFADGVGDGN